MFFTQEQWLKLSIDFTTEERPAAENEFEENSTKNMTLTFFGKSMEIPRDKATIKLKKRQEKKV